jgi:hypothetical protein
MNHSSVGKCNPFGGIGLNVCQPTRNYLCGNYTQCLSECAKRNLPEMSCHRCSKRHDNSGVIFHGDAQDDREMECIKALVASIFSLKFYRVYQESR